ncbi:MAG: hypothetical protein LBK24_01395, partial [Puniceicoccales bacterium]|nr:hypothetical protein [Puniceicoccales bacterium]
MSRTDWNSLEKAIELAGATKSSSIDLREIRGGSRYSSLVNTATKIGHSILTDRRCFSGRIKFTLFPERLLMWSLRRDPIIGALIKELKQGLRDIYHNSESQKLQEGIEGIFKNIGEPIGEPVQPAEISTEQGRNFRGLVTYVPVDGSIEQVRSFLHGHGDVRPGGEVWEIKSQVFNELNIARADSIRELRQEHLQECVNGNKPMVVIEGGNALLIRKNEKGDLEVTKFTTQPKTLTTHGGIQMDSGDYVNAFQLFNLKHKFDPNDPASSLESIRDNLREICNGKEQPKEVPQEQMLLVKSARQNPTNLDFELLRLLQYATKGNQSQEALVARFETDRYVDHLDNIKKKMAGESGPLLEQHIVALNALGRDMQQRVLSLQASGKISPELASECLSKISDVLTRPETGSANPAAVAQSHIDNRAVSLEKANTTYTQNSDLQTSQGCNIQVCDDVPTFLQQAGLNQEESACSARLIMGFASARKFEEFLSNHQGTLESLRGKDVGETLENIGSFFRMAVAYTEYNKRNGIAVPKDKQEIYDNLIKLGAAIYKRYGKECVIDKAENPIHWSEGVCKALFNENKTIENYQDAEPLLSLLDEGVRGEFFTTARGVEDPGQKLGMHRKAAGNGFAYMLLSLAESAKDGIAFDRQSDMGPVVIKNVSFGEQLQSDFKEICGFLSNNPQGKIAKSKYAKRFPFLEHCHLPPGGNALQKTEAMLSWLQTSGNVSVFNNLGMQRMFCKLLCGDANNPQALARALKDRATRKQFVGIANQFFETASKSLPSPVQTEEDMQKYKLYMSLYIQLNGIVKTAGGPELKNNAFSQKISPADMANEELGFACVLCQKMIQKEKLTPDEVLKCTDPKMMIWPEMAGASDTLLERDPEDSSGIKNMFEGVPLEALRGFITDQVGKLTEDEFQRIGQQYAQQRGYEDSQITVDVGSKFIAIRDQDGNVKVNIDLNNFLCLIDGTHPEEHVKTKSDEHPIFTKLGVDGTNIRSRVKIEGDVSTVDGKITIDNRTNKVTMNGKVLVAPKLNSRGTKPTETDRMISRFLPFAEETDAACGKVYLYDPMSLDKPVFILQNGKLYTSDDNGCEYKSVSLRYEGRSEFFHDPRLKMLSPRGETKTNVLERIDPNTNEVLSYMMPEVHYNNQILQFNRHADGELHLASNEQYVLSEPPMPNPLANSKSNYICLRDKDKPSSYKFILVNNKSLIGSSSIDNAVRQKVPILNQDVLEIGFTPSEGFSLGSSNYQAAGILLVGKLFEAGENKQALDILNKISMRDVVAGRNNALLQLVFRSLVADASKGNILKIKKDLTIEGKVATFKIITLLLESDPYNFRNLLLDKGPDGAVVFESSFNLIMQISSLYQSLVDARENSTMEVNLSKENELVIVEEIIGAMSQVLTAAPALQMLMKVTPEKVILNQLPEYGLLKLFEQKHRALVGELGAQTNVKHLTNAAQDSKDHEIVYYKPGGKRSFEKASKFSSALPTRNTEMLAKLRQKARDTSQSEGSSNVERRESFLQKCCRSDAAINGDQELTPRQKADYVAFRNAMEFPQFPDGDTENTIIISSIATAYTSEIEGFFCSQALESKHSEALDGENKVRQSIMGGILRPVKALQAGTQADPERDTYDTYKTNVLLDVIRWDEETIQSNGALTKNDKQLILAFKKKHTAAIHTPEFREQHKLELLDLANAIGGQGKTFSSNNRQGIAQYESTAERELGRYNEEMSLAGSQDLRERALGELYEINAESFAKAEGEEKSPIESAIDDIIAQIETASKEKTDIENKLEEKFSKCSQTMANLRKAKLAKTLELKDLSDVRKALVCAPSDPNGDWSKSIKILQDVNPDYTDTECKEIVNLTRQLLQVSTAVASMEQMRIAAENVRDKGRALINAGEDFPAHGATNLTPKGQDFLLAKNQLLTAYESVRTYDPRADMEALVFESIVGKEAKGFRVRGAQASIIRNVTAQ